MGKEDGALGSATGLVELRSEPSGLGHAATIPSAWRRTLGIAVLSCLAACSARTFQVPADPEVSDTQYETMGLIADRGGDGSTEARAALADGYVTESEYNKTLNDIEAGRKASAINRWKVSK